VLANQSNYFRFRQAAWQIASSTDTVLPHVYFPVNFASIARAISSVLGLGIFEFTSANCILRWSYFERHVFTTLAPLAVVTLGTVLYWLVRRVRGELETIADRRRVGAHILYGTLFSIFVVLPSVSTAVISFFHCSRFDRGSFLPDARIMTVEPSIRCGGRRYRRWIVYNTLMLLVWPVGTPLVMASFLWKNRGKLNPALPSTIDAVRTDVQMEHHGTTEEEAKCADSRETQQADVPVERDPAPPAADAESADAFQRVHRRYTDSLKELAKLKIRESDESVAGLTFLFAEYEPRCYLFPIFEIYRRLFLMSVLTVLYRATAKQVVIGLLGSLVSYVVFAHYKPYVEDDDDIVSTVAQAEVVLTYCGAIAVYAADVSDEGTFSSSGFGVVLIMVFISSFLVATYRTVLEAVSHLCKKRTRLGVFG